MGSSGKAKLLCKRDNCAVKDKSHMTMSIEVVSPPAYGLRAGFIPVSHPHYTSSCMITQAFDAERQIPLPTLFVLLTRALRPVHHTPIRFDAFCSPSEPDRHAAPHTTPPCCPADPVPGRATASPISRLERLAIAIDSFTSCLSILFLLSPLSRSNSLSLHSTASSMHVTRAPGTDKAPDT